MKKTSYYILILLISTLINYIFPSLTFSNNLPWMTGPLFAGAAAIVPFKHKNIEPYLYYINTKSTPTIKTWRTLVVLQYGFYERLEASLTIPAVINNQQGDNQGSGLGDIVFGVYYQLLTANTKTLQPDIALYVSETFPTGKYKSLSHEIKATGGGAYATNLQINLGKLWHISGVHFFRARLNLSYLLTNDVNVQGLNAYGTGAGKVNIGNSFTAIAGFEYSATKNWVPALDILYTTNNKNTSINTELSSPSNSNLSIAPELEYNFNSHLGIVGGIWFNLTANNTDNFISGVIAVNYYN